MLVAARSPASGLLLALGVAAIVVACGEPTAGSRCSSQDDCGSRLLCITSPSGGSACMSPCDERTRLCADGTVCLESPENGRVCWFGGGIPLGQLCAEGGDLACEPGTVCATGAICAQACNLERPSYLGSREAFDPSSVCERTERCEAIGASAIDGVCVAIPDAGTVDAGMAALTSP